jgi:RNA polymerase sigma-70 factor (ECF subfamily)
LKGAIVGRSERHLVRRLRRGDRETCRELIDRYHGRVYGYLRRLGADSGHAEDLTQETYARAWAAVGGLRKAASLRAWLLTIARNEFLKRARAGHPETTALDDLPEPRDEVPGAESEVVRSERDRGLRRAVAHLPPDLMEAVALHYFQDLSLREVGAVLGIPAGTAKSRVHRALDCLRALLQQQEADHEGQRAGKAIAGPR